MSMAVAKKGAELLNRIKAAAASASADDRQLAEYIVIREREPWPLVLSPGTAALLFLRDHYPHAERVTGTREDAILAFAARMTNRSWGDAPTTIRYIGGRLVDGHHRLAAAAFSGVPLAVDIRVV
jgi:hypothetical protein